MLLLLLVLLLVKLLLLLLLVELLLLLQLLVRQLLLLLLLQREVEQLLLRLLLDCGCVGRACSTHAACKRAQCSGATAATGVSRCMMACAHTPAVTHTHTHTDTPKTHTFWLLLLLHQLFSLLPSPLRLACLPVVSIIIVL
jgi:hypothetical protein